MRVRVPNSFSPFLPEIEVSGGEDLHHTFGFAIPLRFRQAGLYAIDQVS